MIITQTPLRISFLGGGTDLPDFYRAHGGAVLNSAIDKYVYCIVKERFDDDIYVNYSEKEIVKRPDDLKHELVREAMKIVGIEKSIEISFLSDIPAAGSGLGSSSSVTVGVLNALHQYVGQAVPAKQLAEEAMEIEITRLKKPMGPQEIYIAAFGGVRLLTFNYENGLDLIEAQRVKMTPEALDDLDNSLMLFYTGVTRKSEVVLKEQKANIPDRAETLKKMARQAWDLKPILEAGRIKELGELLHEGWELKKKLASNISNPQIEDWYLDAREAGALGGKIAGAGAGGFMLLYVPSDKRIKVRKALSELKEMPFHLEPDGSKVIFNYRRR